MEEINRHSFKEALKKIDKDIARRPTVAILPKYQEKAFYIFDKSITAKDMNTFVAELQDKLLDSNIAIETSLNEIKGIYEALEKLDNDYIEGILVSLNKANEAANNAKANTEENTKTINALNLTVNKLLTTQQEIAELKEKQEDCATKISVEKKYNQLQSDLSKKIDIEEFQQQLLVEKKEVETLKETTNAEINSLKEEIAVYSLENEKLLDKFKRMIIAFSITSSALLAGLIASFLI